MQGPTYRVLHKGDSSTCATQYNVLHQEQGSLPARGRGNVGMGIANIVYVSSSYRYTGLAGCRASEIALSNTDHWLCSFGVPGHIAQDVVPASSPVLMMRVLVG